MSQFMFGVGNMYATPLQDASGNVITNPTPIKLLTLQDGNIDISRDVKLLHGQNGFAEAVGLGKGKVDIKVKSARVVAQAWNSLFFGQTLTAGAVYNYTDTTAGGTAIPATPFTLTPGSNLPATPLSGTVTQDLGVINVATGEALTRVASAPAAGQYSYASGVWTFSSADNVSGVHVWVNYQYTVTSVNAPTAQKQTFTNQLMGLAPFFKADLMVQYAGQNTTFSFLRCVASKMTFSLKNEDFAVPEFDFSAMDDGSGNIFTWSTSQ